MLKAPVVWFLKSKSEEDKYSKVRVTSQAHNNQIVTKIFDYFISNAFYCLNVIEALFNCPYMSSTNYFILAV